MLINESPYDYKTIFYAKENDHINLLKINISQSMLFSDIKLVKKNYVKNFKALMLVQGVNSSQHSSGFINHS